MIQACAPRSPDFLDSSKHAPLATFYNLDVSTLNMECLLAKATLDGVKLEEIIDAFLNFYL